MKADLKIDGISIPLDSFVLPEMHLSSSRAEMVRNKFALELSAEDIIKDMNCEYEEWVVESKKDDQICGGPQDELAEAGYPPIQDLVKIPDLVELTFGHYLVRELFNKILPSKNTRIKYWFDEVTNCLVTNTVITFEGICYSDQES